MIDDDTAWVVEIGMPPWVAPSMAAIEPRLAANPDARVIRVIFRPIVSMIFQPPHTVPTAMAAWASRTTHVGGSSELPLSTVMKPPANNVAAITPMVFCASFEPWPHETHIEEPT